MIIYALGSNGSGQLGLGHTEDVSIPTAVPLPESMTHEEVKTIAAGGNHTLILTAAGHVYAAGSNANGRCGWGESPASSTTFRKIAFNSPPGSTTRVDLCIATWDASIFVIHRNEIRTVMVCGAGSKGELAMGEDRLESVDLHEVPMLIPPSTEIVEVASCMGHVVVVMSTGEVYGWGSGRQGQLGERNVDCFELTMAAPAPFKVVRAVCGKDFTCYFSDPSEGKFQIIGLSKRDKFGVKVGAPETLPPWIDVGATWGSIFVLLASGEILAWGRNDHGQLPGPSPPKSTAIAAGSEHCIAHASHGTVLAWGWGEHGNCSLPIDDQGDVKGRFNRLEVPGRVVRVAGGCATSWIVCE